MIGLDGNNILWTEIMCHTKKKKKKKKKEKRKSKKKKKKKVYRNGYFGIFQSLLLHKTK